MDIAVFQHTRGNIGHSFMAAGLNCVLSNVSRRVQLHTGTPLRLRRFEQHRTFDYMPIYSRDRWLKWLPQNRARSWRAAAGERAVAGASDRRPPFTLSIGMSGPAIVPGVSSSDNMRALLLGLHSWGQRHGRRHIEVALGSRWPIGAQAVLGSEDSDFLQRVYGGASWVSARDQTTQDVLGTLGIASTLIPDIAFAMPVGDRDSDTRGILVNLQPDGANENLGRPNWDSSRWQNDVEKLVRGLSKISPVSFLAHSPRDATFLRDIDPGIPMLNPHDVSEYLRIVRASRLVVATRIHAAVAASSQGVPAIGIGQDSRLGVLDLFGVSTFDATADWLDPVQDLAQMFCSEASLPLERYIERRNEVLESYTDAITSEVLLAVDAQ